MMKAMKFEIMTYSAEYYHGGEDYQGKLSHSG